MLRDGDQLCVVGGFRQYIWRLHSRREGRGGVADEDAPPANRNVTIHKTQILFIVASMDKYT